MTVNDPGSHTTEINHNYAPAEPDRVVVHATETKESSAAWWIGALVAIVAILAVVFLVTRSPSTDDAAVANAVEQGRLQGALEGAQTNLSVAQDSASLAAQRAADATAQAAAQATA